MTACVNSNQKREGARRAVGATLAGVLAVGMVPAAALADEAAEAAEEGDEGIGALVGGQVQDIVGGKITGYTDQDGDAVEGTEFALGGDVKYLVPTEVTTKLGEKVKVEDEGLEVCYYRAVTDSDSNPETAADGTKVVWLKGGGAEITSAGTYYAAVYADGSTGAQNAVLLKFTIVDKSLEGATVVGKTKDDTVLEYTGEAQTFSGGQLHVLVDGQTYSKDRFDIDVYKKGALTTDSAKDAGEYVAHVTGKEGSTYAGSTVDIPFTINAMDLSTAKIELNEDVTAVAGTGYPTAVKSANGSDNTELLGALNFEFVSASNGSVPSSAKGSYVYKVTAKDDKNANVTGSQEITVTRYEKAATFKYDNCTINGTLNLAEQDLASGKVFDASKIKVTTDASGKTELGYTISYTKTVNGKQVGVTEADITKPGTYTATITAEDSTYTYGGSATVTFAVIPTQVLVDDVFVTYKGDVVTSISDIYSGSDLMANVAVRAFDEDGEEVPASELELKVTKGDKEVDSVVDAGTYTVAVVAKEGSAYEINGEDNEVDVTVNPVTLKTNEDDSKANADVRLAGDPALGGQESTYAYTGEAVVPTFEYDLTAEPYYDKKKEWTALPESAYKLEYTYYKELGVKDGKMTYAEKGEKVDSAVKAGKYEVKLVDNAKDKNYNANVDAIPFFVSDSKYFADVPVSSDLYDEIYLAAANKYMRGYDGTKLFGPNDTLTRAQAVVVLYNMAGGEELTDETAEWVKDYRSYSLSYADVEGDTWYSQALGWATKTGIVGGYAGTDKFGPTDSITREQWAIMLANYAQKVEGYEAPGADALAEMPDADQVSTWAVDEVSWAVENGIMGKGGYIAPKASITRGEVAAMAVRYQPEPLDTLAFD